MRGPEKTVWARARVSATQCPKSIITAESLALLELFSLWKANPAIDLSRLPARQVDGLIVLEQEWRSLTDHGETR